MADECQWRVEVIPPDERGLALYLQHYKPFRLMSLQLSPSSFSSTYAREMAFDDAAWRARLFKPIATTFVALQGQDVTHGSQVLSSATLLALPVPDDLHLGSIDIREQSSSEPLHWQVNAVFTDPSARRRGIAQAVMRTATSWAAGQAAAEDRDCLLTALVYVQNRGARRLYEASGFEADITQDQDGGEVRLIRRLPRGQAADSQLA